MTASTSYKVDNWRDPEMLFGEEYHPFDLVRDLNGYPASEFEFFGSDLEFPQTIARAESFKDEVKEDVKGDLYTSSQGICNLNTISSDVEESQDCLNGTIPAPEVSCQIATRNSDLVQIRHIYEDGPMIFVTKTRLERIIKQRKRRLAFLERMPEYRLPYKQRSKDIKYKTRSKMAKDRKRNALGKFSSFRGCQDHFGSELSLSEEFSETKPKKKRHL